MALESMAFYIFNTLEFLREKLLYEICELNETSGGV